LFNMLRAIAALVVMFALAFGLDQLTHDFVRTASLAVLVGYSCVAGAALFFITLLIQEVLGNKGAHEIKWKLLGKPLKILLRISQRLKQIFRRN
ncbi:MAG: hypothetical protein HUK20_07895, partial [Fibrobacter sp.]|nr:hypothetical protein [Fibrobacter sp.]